MQQQQVQLRYYTVTAPTAGIVGDVPVRVGMQVSPQTLLTTLDQNETLEVQVAVPDRARRRLKLGLPLQVLSGDGLQTLAMTSVAFISPHVDEPTQSILVKGTVLNPDGALRSSSSSARASSGRRPTGLVVPVTAVSVSTDSSLCSWRRSAGGKLVAKQRAITVGPIVGDDYPVLGGLKPGERSSSPARRSSWTARHHGRFRFACSGRTDAARPLRR